MVPADGSDAAVRHVAESLLPLLRDYRRATADIQRVEAFNIQVRVIDPVFASMGCEGSRERHDFVWGFLDAMPLAELNEIGLIEAVTPEELPGSTFTPDFAALAA